MSVARCDRLNLTNGTMTRRERTAGARAVEYERRAQRREAWESDPRNGAYHLHKARVARDRDRICEAMQPRWWLVASAWFVLLLCVPLVGVSVSRVAVGVQQASQFDWIVAAIALTVGGIVLIVAVNLTAVEVGRYLVVRADRRVFYRVGCGMWYDPEYRDSYTECADGTLENPMPLDDVISDVFDQAELSDLASIYRYHGYVPMGASR